MRGFFEGVCTPSNATAIFRDPPPHTSRIASCKCILQMPVAARVNEVNLSLASSLFETFSAVLRTPHRRRLHRGNVGRSSRAQTPSVLLHGSRSSRSQGRYHCRFPCWAVDRLVGFRLAPHTPHHHHRRRGSAGRSGLARIPSAPPRGFRSWRSRGCCLPHSQDWLTETPLEIQ